MSHLHFWSNSCKFTMFLSLLFHVSLCPHSWEFTILLSLLHYITSRSLFSFLRVHHACHISISVLLPESSPYFYPCYVTSQSLFSFLRVHHDFIPVMPHLYLWSHSWEFTVNFHHLSLRVTSLFLFLWVHYSFIPVTSQLHLCSNSWVSIMLFVLF